MTGDSPSWNDLDLQAGPVPAALQLPSEDGEEGLTTVMVMATAAARDQGWAARATLHLVREWTRAGSRIFLMDLNLDAPDLHGFAGHENREGVSDVVLYGASVPRVSRPVDGGSFYLATAGTAVADASEVLSHSRWNEVIQGFREAGVTLVVYCPHELLDSSPLTRATKVRILLRGPREGHVEADAQRPTPTAVAGPGLGASSGAKGNAPDGPSPDALEDPDASLTQGGIVAGRMGPETPRPPESAHPGEEMELDLGREEPEPDVEDEVASPPLSAVPGKPREVVGTGGGSVVRNVLLVMLFLLVGVLLADYLGYLDLSSVVELPWHEAATATAHLLGHSTE
ncbi:MAG: hypothetical protein WEA09_02075 [Gemmatimonadota bacterium]